MRRARLLLLIGALGTAGAQVTANPAEPFRLPLTTTIPATPLRPPRYCAPIAYRDYEVLVGRAIYVRPVVGCSGPVRVRKVSDLTGLPDAPINIYAPSAGDPPARLWLFVSRLEYTLNGASWRRLVVP